MHRIVMVVVTVATLVTPSLARGQERGSRSDPWPNGHFMAGAGAFTATTGEVGTLFDVMGAARVGPLALGGHVQLGNELIRGYRYVSVGPVVGLFAPTPRWLDLGILGTVGVHRYSHIGRGLLSADPGFDTMLPFAGIRGVAAIGLGSGETRLTLWLQGIADQDLTREIHAYTYTSRNWLSGGRVTTTPVAHVAGTLRYGGLLGLGVTF